MGRDQKKKNWAFPLWKAVTWAEADLRPIQCPPTGFLHDLGQDTASLCLNFPIYKMDILLLLLLHSLIYSHSWLVRALQLI